MPVLDPTTILIPALLGIGILLVTHATLNRAAGTSRSRRIATFTSVGLVQPALPGAQSVSQPNEWPIRAALRAHAGQIRPVLIVAALIGLALGLVTGGPAGPLLTLVASVLAFAMSRGPRTRRQLELQAPMAIGLLSSGLRAGYSVPQSIALVARESPAPTAEEFRQASREIEVGVSLPDALQRLAERTGLAEYQLVAIIVGVQHEVGGDLPHALDDVETTVRERQELREQIAALTAQQRLSSIVLSALPFAIFGFMLAADRQYAEPMLTTLVGRVLLTITVALVGANWFIMQSLGKLE